MYWVMSAVAPVTRVVVEVRDAGIGPMDIVRSGGGATHRA